MRMSDSMDKREFDGGNPQQDAPRRVQKKRIWTRRRLLWLGIVAAVLCLVAPMLTRRMQKRKLFMILCGLDVAVRVVMWFVGYQQVTMLFILLGLSTLFVMMTNYLIKELISCINSVRI